eukprot:4938772-Pleurochrysis_carterae.AAC.2
MRVEARRKPRRRREREYEAASAQSTASDAEMRRARVGPQVKPQETMSWVARAMCQAQRTGRATPDRIVRPPRRATPRAQRIGARRERRRANETSECVGWCRTHVVANKGGGGS